MPERRNGQGSRAHRQSERSQRSAAVEAEIAARVAAESARFAHNGPRPSPRRHQPRSFQSRLFA
ncbi:unnamed protein product, partial [Nesidiocoris tenuis]